MTVAMNNLHWLSYLSIAVVALSSMTSVTIGALSHIFIIAPALYFFWKCEDKLAPLTMSQWALIGVIDAIFLSVLFNWGSIGNPVGAILKAKYFFLIFLGLYAWRETFAHWMNEKRIKILLTLFIVATTAATLSGLVGLWTGFNPLRFKEACHETRACGLFGMYMTYGYGISLSALIMLGLCLYRDEAKKWVNIPLLYSCTVINIVGLYLSFARGAWIGFLVALPFFFFKSQKKAFLSVTAAGIIFSALAVVISPAVKETFFSDSRLTSNSIRVSQFEAAWMAFKESPIVGLGYREFEPNVPRLKEEHNIDHPNFAGHAHNNFIEHLASTGILGFIAVICFHLFWLWEMYRRSDLVARITFPFVISFIVSGMFQYSFGDGENLFLVMMVYALSQIPGARRESVPH